MEFFIYDVIFGFLRLDLIETTFQFTNHCTNHWFWYFTPPPSDLAWMEMGYNEINNSDVIFSLRGLELIGNDLSVVYFLLSLPLLTSTRVEMGY